MKFTKDDAFKQIESYLTDNGKKELLLSGRSVNAALDTLMPLLAEEETELSVFIDKVKPMFQTMYGNLKYDTSRFVKKWQDEHPEEQKSAGEPAKDEKDPIMERIERLEAEIAKRDKDAAIRNKMGELEKALSDKGVKDSQWVRELLSEVSVTEDTDVNAAAEKYLKLYNRVNASAPANVTPNGSGSKQKNESPFGDVVAQRKAQAEALKGTITTN